MKVTARVRGANTLARAFRSKRAVPTHGERAVGVTAVANRIRDDAKSELAPSRETGGLIRSVENAIVRQDLSSRNKNVTLSRVGIRLGYDSEGRYPARYAHLIHWGTRHSSGNPFMEKAFNRNAPLAEKNMGAVIGPLIEQRLRVALGRAESGR